MGRRPSRSAPGAFRAQTTNPHGSHHRGPSGGTMKTWLTVAEGAEYSGVSRDTIYTACERRELRHARIGGRRAIRLKPEWIDAWLERHTEDARDSRIAPPTATQPPAHRDGQVAS